MMMAATLHELGPSSTGPSVHHVSNPHGLLNHSPNASNMRSYTEAEEDERKASFGYANSGAQTVAPSYHQLPQLHANPNGVPAQQNTAYSLHQPHPQEASGTVIANPQAGSGEPSYYYYHSANSVSRPNEDMDHLGQSYARRPPQPSQPPQHIKQDGHQQPGQPGQHPLQQQPQPSIGSNQQLSLPPVSYRPNSDDQTHAQQALQPSPSSQVSVVSGQAQAGHSPLQQGPLPGLYQQAAAAAAYPPLYAQPGQQGQYTQMVVGGQNQIYLQPAPAGMSAGGHMMPPPGLTSVPLTSMGGAVYTHSTAIAPASGAPSSSGPPPHLMTTFNSKISLRSLKKHACHVCQKRFTRPSSLQTHMYSHTGEKPFKCDFDGCGRSFSVVSNLRRHKKIHGIFS